MAVTALSFITIDSITNAVTAGLNMCLLLGEKNDVLDCERTLGVL